MLEFVIATQAVVIIALAGTLVSQYGRLFRAAMSRTPGEYRAAEIQAHRKPTPPNPAGGLDEDVKAVLDAVSPGAMPHGLGGS